MNILQIGKIGRNNLKVLQKLKLLLLLFRMKRINWKPVYTILDSYAQNWVYKSQISQTVQHKLKNKYESKVFNLSVKGLQSVLYTFHY